MAGRKITSGNAGVRCNTCSAARRYVACTVHGSIRLFSEPEEEQHIVLHKSNKVTTNKYQDSEVSKKDAGDVLALSSP